MRTVLRAFFLRAFLALGNKEQKGTVKSKWKNGKRKR